ncbi:MAG TPA: DsbC family protein [Aquifex aeolicus]|uniref:DsbC family protein n=1 Tax=Aquifex aeolicus TaxID=63363 RepID=A0A9D0YPR3_AQUAO|nr:DsbC family protein [Aquificales bacterium]HIP98233.1 DsbC family protein [Aquifex aeolicus]HIQ26597.1 DsbC family protein [Aquifex aeolicus]
MIKKIIPALFLGLSPISFACPTVEHSQKVFNQLFKANLKVENIKKAPLKGLCEAVVSVGGQKVIFYTDESGRYLLLGRGPLVAILDTQTKEDLTQKELQELNKLSPNQLRELEKYVAFTYGKSGKVVYLFTDPECPFCQRLEPTLKKLADEGKIRVKVILFPLPFHTHAKEKSVAIVCRNIGWEGLTKDYWTSDKMEKLKGWQCQKGENFVEDSVEIGKKYGISGTPTIITQEGKKVVGALPEKMLVKELGLDEKKDNKP